MDLPRTLRTVVPPRDPKGQREGFTTGACAAAAAKAAVRLLLRGEGSSEIESTLPNGQRHTFVLERCERTDDVAVCSIVKDAGDDPDCTHGAEIVAEVSLRAEPGIELRGGEGVARVTKPGLGLEVGGPAINPVPRRNITAMVLEELAGSAFRGAVVTIRVPGGEELAKQTINARLGLLGGISILGTTGIVKPYSTAAYKASVVQAIDVARERGQTILVLTTGGKSEAYAMKLYPELAEEAFVQVGDFVGVGVKHCARRGAERAVVVGMIGKLSKMADGRTMTHAAGSEVNMELLAGIARDLGAGEPVVSEIRAANTARHVMEIAAREGITQLCSSICERVVFHLGEHVGGALDIHAVLVDFNGAVLGRYPSPAPTEAS
ncbi:cobalt-precorrin-5B (C(1))-methyltransferase [Pendulispora albinea]|uniref:Cobalt-precorrin-5B C(1)-methyltransferase n=1 Tax=Pendulispora albinea TaxID=2741071 RepID=A0ABZ2LXJ5_9BACT